MIYNGFKFGMLLQLAVGPVCIFMFQTASLKGFYIAETGVLGVTIVDGFYILAAILGIGSIIDRKKVKFGLKLFGTIILFIFGLNIISSQFNINLLPGLDIQNTSGSNSAFVDSIILAISNPLTILFWAGVFSNKILEEDMTQKDIYAFGFGALMSTISFLTLISLIGSTVKSFLPLFIIKALNLTVGFLLIYFSIRMITRKV